MPTHPYDGRSQVRAFSSDSRALGTYPSLSQAQDATGAYHGVTFYHVLSNNTLGSRINVR